jgi:hypothetical protein
MNERDQMQDFLGEEGAFFESQPISIIASLIQGIPLLKGIMLNGHVLKELCLNLE